MCRNAVGGGGLGGHNRHPQSGPGPGSPAQVAPSHLGPGRVTQTPAHHAPAASPACTRPPSRLPALLARGLKKLDRVRRQRSSRQTQLGVPTESSALSALLMQRPALSSIQMQRPATDAAAALPGDPTPAQNGKAEVSWCTVPGAAVRQCYVHMRVLVLLSASGSFIRCVCRLLLAGPWHGHLASQCIRPRAAWMGGSIQQVACGGRLQ